MRLKTLFVAVLRPALVVVGYGTAYAAPLESNSPNLEEPFPVVCDGAT